MREILKASEKEGAIASERVRASVWERESLKAIERERE